MSEIGSTDLASEEPSIADPVGFGGSEFDPGVWVAGEAAPFGEVWVNVESGVVVGSLGGAVIDPSEIDGRVDIDEMWRPPVGAERPGEHDAERGEEWWPTRDAEFDPETGAFVVRDEVVGWTADAGDEVGWVDGVGYYHEGTGEWYDAELGQSGVPVEFREGGRYVSLDDLSGEQREDLLRDAGLEEADVGEGMFFDPVTGSLHLYDPEDWAYDGSTWVNLETGATADSPTGDETGRYDNDDLETLREHAAGEETLDQEPVRDEAIEEPGVAAEEEMEPVPAELPEAPIPEPEATSEEASPAEPSDTEEETEAPPEPPTAEMAEPEPLEVHEPEAADAVEEVATAEVGEPEPLEVHESDAGDEAGPEVPTESGPESLTPPPVKPEPPLTHIPPAEGGGEAEEPSGDDAGGTVPASQPEVIVAPTETPIAEIYEPEPESEEPESFDERTTEAYEPPAGEPLGGGSPPAKEEPVTMEGIEPDAAMADEEPATRSETNVDATIEPSIPPAGKPEPPPEESTPPAAAEPSKPEPGFDVGVSPPREYSHPGTLESLIGGTGKPPDDEDLTAEEIAEGIRAADDTDSVDLPTESGSDEAHERDLPGWVSESSPAEPTKPEQDSGVRISPVEGISPLPDLGGDHPMEHLVPPDRRGTEDTTEAPPAEEPATGVAEAPPEAPTIDLHEPEAGPEVAVAPTEVPVVDVHEPESTQDAVAGESGSKEPVEPTRVFAPPIAGEAADDPEVIVASTEAPIADVYEPEPDAEPGPEVVVAPTETPTADIYEPEPEVIVAPTEAPTADVYESEPEPAADAEAWKGLDAGGVEPVGGQEFGEWSPLEPLKEMPSESVADQGEAVAVEPQRSELDQPPVSWETASQSEVDDFGVELVPTEAAGIIREPVGGGDEDLEPTSSVPPEVQEPVEVLPEAVPIESDLVTFEEPMVELEQDLSVMPIDDEPLPLLKDPGGPGAPEPMDTEEEDYLDD